jgi:hypothetical protein
MLWTSRGILEAFTAGSSADAVEGADAVGIVEFGVFCGAEEAIQADAAKKTMSPTVHERTKEIRECNAMGVFSKDSWWFLSLHNLHYVFSGSAFFWIFSR